MPEESTLQIRFSGAKTLPMIHQAEASEGGLACLAMIANYHGYRTDLNELRREHSVSMKGATVRSLLKVANVLGLAGRPVRIELSALPRLRRPAILHWNLNHFVVLQSIDKQGAVIHDPAFGIRRVEQAELSKRFSGMAVEFQPTADFSRKEAPERLRLSDFWRRTTGLRGSLFQTMVLSIALQFFVIASPFYLQLIVDEAIAKGDHDLLIVLAVAFAMLQAINISTAALRSFVLMYLGNQFSFQMAVSLFRHLVRLPLPYFEKRQMGDIMSRFESLTPVHELITKGIVASLIDGLMAILTLTMIFVVNSTLALVVLAAALLYLMLRLVMFRRFRRRNMAAIQARARENSNFIETLRAVQTVKLFGKEEERQTLWTNLHAETVSARAQVERLDIIFEGSKMALFGAENILVVYLAAVAVLENQMTIGMIYAFLSYKRQFEAKFGLLIEQAIKFRMLELHLERLGDIGLTDKEDLVTASANPVEPIEGRLTIQGVSYRYGVGDEWVLSNVSFEIRGGEHVALVGPSGGGKTTLAKLILNVFEAQRGKILLDGLPITALSKHRYRSLFGTVMQEDVLFSGSVAENIAFFDDKADRDKIVRCAHAAALHDDILKMPMQYDSLIGDMGNNLSGGQRQRLLLARALYRDPKILVMDEGTSALDVATERYVNDEIAKLSITRITIAHRPETIRYADRVFVVKDAKVEEVSQESRRMEVMGPPR